MAARPGRPCRQHQLSNATELSRLLTGCASAGFLRTRALQDAFHAEIDTDFFEGEPTLGIYQMIEEGDAVAVTGGGKVSKKGGEQAWFVFSEVFHFSGQLISRLETYHIWVP